MSSIASVVVKCQKYYGLTLGLYLRYSAIEIHTKGGIDMWYVTDGRFYLLMGCRSRSDGCCSRCILFPNLLQLSSSFEIILKQHVFPLKVFPKRHEFE